MCEMPKHECGTSFTICALKLGVPVLVENEGFPVHFSQRLPVVQLRQVVLAAGDVNRSRLLWWLKLIPAQLLIAAVCVTLWL